MQSPPPPWRPPCTGTSSAFRKSIPHVASEPSPRYYSLGIAGKKKLWTPDRRAPWILLWFRLLSGVRLIHLGPSHMTGWGELLSTPRGSHVEYRDTSLLLYSFVYPSHLLSDSRSLSFISSLCVTAFAKKFLPRASNQITTTPGAKRGEVESKRREKKWLKSFSCPFFFPSGRSEEFINFQGFFLSWYFFFRVFGLNLLRIGEAREVEKDCTGKTVF